MTFKDRIADWISGGKFSSTRRQRDGIEAHLSIAERILIEKDREIKFLLGTLSNVVDQEKPTSNATVKRMARLARNAIKDHGSLGFYSGPLPSCDQVLLSFEEAHGHTQGKST